jgi:hypothetical protein
MERVRELLFILIISRVYKVIRLYILESYHRKERTYKKEHKDT